MFTLAASGVRIPPIELTVEMLRAQILPLPPQSDGAEELRRIHAHWLTLKHDFGDRVNRQYLEHDERAAAENTSSVHAAAAQLIHAFRERHGAKLSLPTVNDAAIEREIEGLARVGADASALREHVKTLIATTSGSQLVTALRAHRVSLEEAAVRERARSVAVRLEREQRAERAADLAAHVTMLSEQLDVLDESVESRLRAQLCELQRDAPLLPAQVVDDRLATVQRVVYDERRRAAMESIVRKALRRLGYEHVENMQTITPADVRAGGNAVLYFRDPQDRERYVELAFANGDSVSVEIVRPQAHLDGSQRARDTLAQRRLCDAMKTVERIATEAFAITMIHDAEPGGASGVRERLRSFTERHAARDHRKMQT